MWGTVFEGRLFPNAGERRATAQAWPTALPAYADSAAGQATGGDSCDVARMIVAALTP